MANLNGKLSFEEYGESFKAIKDFHRKFSENNIKTNIYITDERGDIECFYENMEVVIPNSYDTKVNIMWENQVADFRDRGLYGRYWPEYQKMRFENNQLKIYSDDKVIHINLPEIS